MSLNVVRLAAIALLLTSPPILADESETKLTGSQLAMGIALTEAVIVANAYLAAENPQVYGAALTVLGPIGALAGGSNDYSMASRWAGAASAAALGIYHIAALDRDELTKEDIRKRSFVAWHAMLIPIGITAFVAGDFNKKRTSASLAIDPYDGRPMLMFARRFWSGSTCVPRVARRSSPTFCVSALRY